MAYFKKFPPLLVAAVTIAFNTVSGQQTPFRPVSYRIFTPFIFNPAIAGSKDFLSVDLSAGREQESNTQVLSGNLRFVKKTHNYFSTQPIPEFSNIGAGGYIYNEYDGVSRNIGLSAGGSYHFGLDENSLSFLSVGVSGKAIYNKYAGNPDLGESEITTFFANIDAGIYYYRPNLYAGLSATNLLGAPDIKDTTSTYSINVSRQFFFNAGYKLVLSRVRNIILEPMIILNSDDSFSADVLDMIQPGLKLYAGNFCCGTYFSDFDRYSFFFQFKYNSFYIGTFFSLPNKSPFYKSPIIEEIAVGINLSSIRSGISRVYHW